MLTGHRMPVTPEAHASAHMVLPQARLGLVQPKRSRRSQRGAVMLFRQPLFIHAMAGFVQNAIKRLSEVLFVVARSQAAIARAERSAEGVCSGINATGFKIKPDSFRDFPIQSLLCGDG